MKVNFNIPVLHFNGTPLKENNEEVTLGSLVVAALLAPSNSEGATVEEKLKLYDIAQRISDSKDSEIMLDAQEAQTMISLVAKTYPSPLIVGRLNDEVRKA